MENYVIFVKGQVVKTCTIKEDAKTFAQKKSVEYPKLTFEVVAEDIMTGSIHTIALYENGEDFWN